ncbi:MAG: hypothetical protein K2X11_10330 [Acetobacteraceae bacterium]|nr:hypothetical protein [Acetobacteraceae bacterium]
MRAGDPGFFDRTPWGEALAARVWRAVRACRPDDGHIAHAHRDYCGHGLVRTASGVKLCEIEDGFAHGKPAIVEWKDEASFVAFFARQSDWSCAGFDPAEPVFFTGDCWARGNQRLRRAEVERFCGGR